MRKYFALLLVLTPFIILAQDNNTDKQKKTPSKSGFGFKGGLNFANVSKASSINGSNRTGFNVGAFKTSGGPSIFSFRMEFDFSRQGYNFKTNTNTGTVDLDYILWANFTAINLGKFGQIYVGAQMAYLLNAKADSTSSQVSAQMPAAGNPMMKYLNRLDYGLGGGLEIYPYKGILVGARFNMSLGNSFQSSGTPSDPAPSYMPGLNAKNNVVQIYIGYKFSKKS